MDSAARLHDTVEDCPPTSFAEIDQEFSSEVASIVREMTDDKSSYYQKHGKTAYPEAEALIFVQVSPTSGMGIAMWPSKEIREKEGLAQRPASTERFGASIKEHVPYWGEVLVKQIK